MPMPLKTDRPRRVEVAIPSSIWAKAQVELFSEVEGRVPHGEASKLVTELLVDWLRGRGVVV